MADEPEGEAPARRAPARGGGGGFSFSKQLGPLPVWAWMSVVLALAVIYSIWHKNKQAAATNTNSASSATQQAADQTPPFIIQNYTTNAPGPPGPAGPPGATGATGASGTTTSPVTQGGNPPRSTAPPVLMTPTPTPKPTAPKSTPATTYRVKPGDNLTTIAAKFDVKGGADALWAYNIGTGPGTANRPAATIATLKQRGKNLLYTNEEIYIPAT